MFKLISFFILGLSISCSNSGESQNSPTEEVQPDAASSADNVAAELSLTVGMATGTKLDTLNGYLVGHISQYKLQRIGQSNSYAIPSVANGVYDLIIYTQDGTDSVGKRINGITLKSDGGISLSNVQLEPTVTLTGKARVSGDNGNSPVTMTIEGTHYSTELGEDGNYAFLGVVPGKHSVSFTAQDYQSGKIAHLDLSSVKSLEIPEMVLHHDSETGVYPLDLNDPSRVGFVLKSPATANMFRISSNSNFANSEWQHLSTTQWLSYEEVGEKTVYVQYSIDKNSLSAVFSSTFTVEEPEE